MMGFSYTHTETRQFGSSAILFWQLLQRIEKGAFMQFVWDNADVNENPIDGKNTFHEMGGIIITTPHSLILSQIKICYLKEECV